MLAAHVEKHIGTLRDAVGPDEDINLDLNWHFKPEACARIARALEPFNLHWLEIDIDDVPWKDELVTHAPEIIKITGAVTPQDCGVVAQYVAA